MTWQKRAKDSSCLAKLNPQYGYVFPHISCADCGHFMLFYSYLMLFTFFLHLFSTVPATLPWSLRDLHRVTGRCTWSAANSFLHVRGFPSIDVCVSSGIWNRRCWRNFPMSTTEMIWSDDVFGHCESDCEQQILNRLRLFRYFDVFCMCAVCTDRCNFEPPLNLLREQ